MAIQAQIYHDCSGLPPFNPPGVAGGGGVGGGVVWMNQQSQQFLQNILCRDMETPSFCSSDSQFAFEINHFILSQNERLRQVLREQWKRDVTELLKKAETRTSFLIHQKDEEIAKAKSRTSQLESLLMKLQTDMLTWQQLAKRNELHVINLHNAIQLLQQQQQQKHLHESIEPLVEDAESCCDDQQQETQQERRVNKMVCRVCEMREVSVVMLPCRHMCACSVCDPIIGLCPVCQIEKKGSIEAMFC